MEKLLRLLGCCLVVLVFAFATTWFFNRQGSAEGANSSINAGVRTGTAEEKTYTLNDSALSADIGALLQANSDLDTSVSVVDLQTGKHYHWGEKASYTAASIGKLVTATAYLYRVELGKASLDDRVGTTTARDQLTKLIVESDNTAWHNFNTIITPDGLQQYAQSLGLNTYSAADNIMSSDDTALLLSKLAGQKLLTKEHTDFLLSLMKEASMRAYIVAAIPAGTDVYHKVGYLEDRLHDAAIIKHGDRSYVLVIFSKTSGNYDFSRGASFFGSLTEATLKAFFPAS